MHSILSRFLLVALTLGTGTGFAAERTLTPFIVRNLNLSATHQPHDVDVYRTLLIGDDLYYMSWGPRLWRTNGDAGGTFRLGDAADPDALPGWGGFIGTISRKLIYLGRDNHLWASDGTTPGGARLMPAPTLIGTAPCGTKLCMSLSNHTIAVTDATPQGSSVIAVTHPPNGMTFPLALASNGKEAFFSAYDDRGVCVRNAHHLYCGELWASDGTSVGTRLVKDIVPGAYPSAPDYMVGWKGLLFFKALVPERPFLGAASIFVSDGTEAGTRPLIPGHAEDHRQADPRFTPGGEYVYFNTLDWRTWRSDGTPEGTRPLSEIVPFADPSTLGPVVVTYTPDLLYFATFRHDDHSVRLGSEELWSFDGRDLTKIHGGGNAAWVLGYFPPTGRTYYLVDSGGEGWDSVLYSTDGRGPGIPVAAVEGRSRPFGPFLIGSRTAFFFVNASGGSRWELWQTDGTGTGTYRVPNGMTTDRGSEPSDLVAWGNRVYFFAKADGDVRQLVSTGGDARSTRAIMDCETCGQLEIVGERLFFRNGVDWFIIDESGLSASSLGAVARPPMRLDEVEISWRQASGDSVDLWRSDRSTPFARVRGRAPIDAAVVSRKLYFTADGALWITDGTKDGTFLLHQSGVESPLVAIGDRLLFFADARPWATDGTRDGTVPLSSVSGGIPRFLGSAGKVHLFQLQDGLWRTDGSASATFPLESWKGPFAFSASLGNRVILVRRDEPSGGSWEIITSDGSVEGTRSVKRLSAINHTVRVAHPVAAANGKWYLPYFDGRVQLLDLDTLQTIEMEGGVQIPGLSPSMADDGAENRRFAAVGERLLFPAATRRSGIELWGVNLDGIRAPLPTVSVWFAGIGPIGGQRAAVFRISADVEGAFTPAVRFETADGTAVAGRDYTPASGRVSLTEADGVAWIVIPIEQEAQGVFHLILSGAEHAAIDRGTAAAWVSSTPRRRAVRR